MSTVHAIAQTGFGAGTNELYDRARPTYPAAPLSFIRSAISSPEPLNLVEIGAGTGLFTRALLAHPAWSSCVARLRAVEPSEGMRSLWTQRVADERASIEDGTFAHTSVPDGWADFVLIAQAFHWCPHYDRACAEFARILKPSGAAVFIWNLEDRDQARWVAQVRERIERHEQDTPQFRLGLWRRAFSAPSYLEHFSEQEETVWSYHVPATEQLVVNRALSKSYISVLAQDEKERVAADLKDVLARGEGRVWIDEKQGVFEYPYKTYVVLSRRK